MMGIKTNNIIKAKQGIFPEALSRRAFIKQISIFSCVLVSGCSTMRVLLDAYPERFKSDRKLIDKILISFVTAIIPGAPIDKPDLTKIYYDDYYPFHKYLSFFAYDISDRSTGLYGEAEFYELSIEQRTAVIKNALGSDDNSGKLYQGAIFMAQASFYGGIYDDEKGCPFIDFHGRNDGFSPDEMYYTNNTSLLAAESTKDGNYN